jgi:signal transduction histidine kinase
MSGPTERELDSEPSLSIPVDKLLDVLSPYAGELGEKLSPERILELVARIAASTPARETIPEAERMTISTPLRPQNLLRTVMDGVPLSLYCLDVNGLLVTANSGGIESTKGFLGDDVEISPGIDFFGLARQRVPQENWDELWGNFKLCLEGKLAGQFVHKGEEEGKEQVHVTSMMPVYDGLAIAGVVITSYQITQFWQAEMGRLETEEKLRQIQREVTLYKQNNQTVGDFLHAVSNACAPIFGYLQEVNISTLDSSNADSIKRSLAAMDVFRTILRNLKETSQAGKLELSEAYAYYILESAFEQAAARNSQNQVTFNVHYAKEKTSLRADYVKLITVIGDLAINAVHAAWATSGTVTMTYLEDDGYIVFEVSDDGTGIGAEHINNIFEREYSTKIETDSLSILEPDSIITGSGIGLHNVKSVVDLHGGKIHLHTLAAGHENGRPVFHESECWVGEPCTSKTIAEDMPGYEEMKTGTTFKVYIPTNL